MPPGLEPRNHTYNIPVYAHMCLEVIERTVSNYSALIAVWPSDTISIVL
jgi:hypothetical protein